MSAAEDSRSSAAVAHEAEDVRASLAHTLDQLRDNLKPQHVVEEVVGNAKIGASTLVDTFYSVARKNPLPAFLIAVGAAMMLGVGARTQGRLGKSSPGPLRTRAVGGSSLSRIDGPDLAGSSTHRSSMYRPDGISASAQTSERVRDQMKTSISSPSPLPPAVQASRLSGVFDDQPLIIAALGVAVGAAIGAALPITRMEDELIGGTSVSVRHMARDMVQDEVDGLTDAAGRMAQTVKQSAVDRGMSSQNVNGFVRDVGEQAKTAIHDLGTQKTAKQPGM